jgi:dienelactone hydrolase
VRLALALLLAACQAHESTTPPVRSKSKPAGSTTSAAPDAGAPPSSVLRGVVHVGDYDRASIQATLSPGVVIDNGYAVDTITFVTSGREARATVTTPFGVPAPAGGWHVVANAHGTTGLDDPCAVAGTLWGSALAGTFGARGFVGVAVDYPGLGTPGILPYLVSEVEGRAVLDALRAARQLAKDRAVPLSQRFAVVGLSQGGHAALAAAMQHQAYAPDLDIRAFAAAGPASGFEEHWRAGANVDGTHIPVHALLVHAWATHYGYGGPPIWSAATAPSIAATMSEACMYSPIGAPALGDRVGTAAAAVFSPEFLAAYRSGNWGAFGAFGEAFGKNRIAPYPQSAPLKIYQGSADAIVPEWATRQLVLELRAGGVTVDYDVVPGGGHTDVAFGFVAYQELRTNESIAWLRERLGS